MSYDQRAERPVLGVVSELARWRLYIGVWDLIKSKHCRTSGCICE